MFPEGSGAGTASEAGYGRMVLWLKGLAVGFAIGAFTMGIVTLWSYRTDSAEPAPKEAAQAPPERADSPAAAVARVHALAAEEETSEPEPPTPLDPALSSVAVAMPALRPNRVAELAALDSARAALAAKNPEAALVELERYERNYPSLSFGLRAQLLRIEALSAAGRPQAARELAATYITTYPDSPHAQRLRAFVAGEAWTPQ